MTDRITTLTVATKGAEEWFRLFEQLSVLANRLGSTYDHVSVSSTAIDEIDADDNANELYFDEYTLIKVRNALKMYMKAGEIDGAINELLNAGILFRERVKTDDLDRSRTSHS